MSQTKGGKCLVANTHGGPLTLHAHTYTHTHIMAQASEERMVRASMGQGEEGTQNQVPFPGQGHLLIPSFTP